jgi:hypothetical protein
MIDGLHCFLHVHLPTDLIWHHHILILPYTLGMQKVYDLISMYIKKCILEMSHPCNKSDQGYSRQMLVSPMLELTLSYLFALERKSGPFPHTIFNDRISKTWVFP